MRPRVACCGWHPLAPLLREHVYSKINDRSLPTAPFTIFLAVVVVYYRITLHVQRDDITFPLLEFSLSFGQYGGGTAVVRRARGVRRGGGGGRMWAVGIAPQRLLVLFCGRAGVRSF